MGEPLKYNVGKDVTYKEYIQYDFICVGFKMVKTNLQIDLSLLISFGVD